MNVKPPRKPHSPGLRRACRGRACRLCSNTNLPENKADRERCQLDEREIGSWKGRQSVSLGRDAELLPPRGRMTAGDGLADTTPSQRKKTARKNRPTVPHLVTAPISPTNKGFLVRDQVPFRGRKWAGESARNPFRNLSGRGRRRLRFWHVGRRARHRPCRKRRFRLSRGLRLGLQGRRGVFAVRGRAASCACAGRGCVRASDACPADPLGRLNR
jgi:hypothetical protein